MIKKSFLFFISVALLLAVSSLTGCKSPGRNPAGVYGAGGIYDDGGAYDSTGTIPMSGRFTGGSEYAGLFAPVLFAYDSTQVGADQRAKIEAVGSELKQNPNHAVIVEGHCDERGSHEYNLALGEQRALAVRAYLTGLGVGADRIQTKSYGEERPANPGHDTAAWNQNRRSEFVLYY